MSEKGSRDPGRLHAVTARADVTPEALLPLGGFANRTAIATGRHAPLEANLVWLRDDDGHGLVWIAIDVLAIRPELRDPVVARVSTALDIDPGDIVIVASHTHSAPATWHGTIHPILPASSDASECDRVARVIAGAAAGAAANPPHRVTARIGLTGVTGVGSNRHRPDGPNNNTSTVMTMQDDDGTVHAVVFDYACHPTVLGPDNTLYSPDWVGGARARIREVLHLAPTTPVVYLPGSGGDISTRFNRVARSQAEAMRLGGLVGDTVGAAARRATAVDIRSGISLDRSAFDARSRRPEKTAPAPIPAPATASRRAESIAEGVASLRALAMSATPEIMRIDTALAGIGDHRWLHTPFEISTVWGESITAGADNLRLVGYSDGYTGYLADRASHEQGEYEALASYFDWAETERIARQLRDIAIRTS